MKPHYKSPIKLESALGPIEFYGKYKIGGAWYIICHDILPKDFVYNDTGYDLYKFGIDKTVSKYSRQDVIS